MTVPTRSVARSAAGMGVAATVSRGFGAVRVLVIAAVLGTTYLGNAFQGSNQFSTVVFELLAAGALSAVLVPTFVEHLDRGDQRRAEELAGGLLGVAVLALGGIALVGVLVAPWLADLLVSGVSDPATAAQQQELSTFLLRFFLPQIVLYGVGAVATAILNAQRVFALPAAAPIGNTVVMVVLLVVFAVVAGPDPGLVLGTGERLLLAAAGTLGVAAFAGIPTVALLRRGFRLRVRPRLDAGVRRLLGLGGWATLQHASVALLLGTAIVVGGSVEGGVVAFQVGWFFFMAPYGVIAQPIQTAVQPELVGDLARGDHHAFGESLRWSLDSMAVLLLPVTAGMVALAHPVADVIAFGQARTGDGVELIAAGIAGLGLGLLPYGAFLLFARAWYAFGDSRAPAILSVVAAIAGSAVMVSCSTVLDGAALVAVLGAAHALAFGATAIALAVGIRRRTGEQLKARRSAIAALLSLATGLLAWRAAVAWDPSGRFATLVTLVVVVGVLGGGYLVLVRWLGLLVPRPADRAEVPA